MKIFITRNIPDRGIKLLQERGHEVTVSSEDRVLTKEELIAKLKAGGYDAVLCLLTDKIDADVMDAAGKQVKIFANYAVGFDNVDIKAAAERAIFVTNTPGVLTNSVAEFAFALILAIAHRIPEADRFSRAGKYQGWEPELLLGQEISGKTLGIVGLGRIGSRVAFHARGFEMPTLYYDVVRNEAFEKESGAVFSANVDDVLREADIVSIHVPLLPTTKHLINAERLALMKPTAYLVNTSRGPVVDEAALLDALRAKRIRGAALDVWEFEPKLTPGLTELDTVILTPHIASATDQARQEMSRIAAENIIAALEGKTPPNIVKG
ncbi:D-glycerate dehydrogenase [Candidatus Parcubacteria bacterium]|nr:MAG: D-glycerate dehydrogenase [Candidatus Parcubacteria bacterium]